MLNPDPGGNIVVKNIQSQFDIQFSMGFGEWKNVTNVYKKIAFWAFYTGLKSWLKEYVFGFNIFMFTVQILDTISKNILF